MRIKSPDIVPQDRSLEVQEYTIYSQDRTVNENREEQGLDKTDHPRADVPVRLLTTPFTDPEESAQMGMEALAAAGESHDEKEVGSLPGAKDPEAEVEDEAQKIARKTELDRWKRVALREFRDGRAPAEREFKSVILSEDVRERVSAALRAAESEDDVKAAFSDAPAVDVLTDADERAIMRVASEFARAADVLTRAMEANRAD